MAKPQDESRWLPEAQVLRLAELSRSTLRSWAQADLKFAAGAAYDLKALVAIVLLAKCRSYLSPKEMAGAWRRVARTGAEAAILEAAKELEQGGRFDLIVDPQYASLTIARSDAELAQAVRRPSAPRAMIVVDVAEPVFAAVEHFTDHANKGSQPTRKAPGRPRSPERGLRVVSGGSES